MTTKHDTTPITWHSFPEHLPPGSFFSPDLWLALSDGDVVKGQCLHRSPNAESSNPIHSWFCTPEDEGSQSLSLYTDATVIAWALIQPPTHPSMRLTDELQRPGA